MMRWYQMRRRGWMPPMLMTRRLPPFWLCQPTPRWLMPPRLLWSPYLRCSPQMLRMKLPTKIPLENQPVRAGFFYAYN
ncbi:hypothetical protein A674_04194 [Salmonella enterica subsp. enterica serovar Enteritidis str. 2009K1651]|nr:hypothetical protein A674_04194 [Salmonella enterica subsp. enterica serovar Enteritidis str. 2009K1651]EPI93515.1 hypothetical protein A678_04849 [Salmonella enterica subsp. enterica serovar Enteritidis str. 2010K-0271]EPI97606.1 hypothetical protein A677_03113 [Salmonella enterica subsp. enterica serovar Enteritidis str. 2010K-0267]EPJ08719.1 hypothetical protein A680_04219 [Salmonella enterica subsp. enterica serovar Enteritidis str. 2010K-0286]